MQALVLSVVPLAFLVVVLVLSALFQGVAERTSALAGTSARALDASDALLAILEVESSVVDPSPRRTHPRDPHAFDLAAAKLAPTLDRLGALVTGQHEEAANYNAYRTTSIRVQALLRSLDDLRRSGQTAKVKVLINAATTATLVQRWQAQKNTFDQTERTLALRRYDEARRAAEPLRVATLVVAATGVVVTLALALGFGLRLARRLRQLADNASRLAAGDSPRPIGGDDEIASLDAVYRELFVAYDREYRASSILQHALLPQTLPQVEGLRIDTAYISAGEDDRVGGDWYDVFMLTPEIVGISAGDVAGHGLRAATRMNAVRQAIRTAARAAEDPGLVMRHVNRVVCADEDEAFVSALYATYDRTDGTLRYALAGHPAPIVLGADGEAELLTLGGVVLGVDARMFYATATASVPVGGALVVYTDGLVENRRDAIDGTRVLIEAARAEFLERSANPALALQRRVLGSTPSLDDSAVLFLRVLARSGAAAGTREWAFDARRETEATRVKRALLWELAGLAEHGWDLGTIEAIYGELASNVARHTPGPARVVLERRDGEIVLHVDDRGAPFTPPPGPPDLLAESGRGIFLVRALARELRIAQVDGGNRISVVLPGPEHAALDLTQAPRRSA